MQKGSKYREWGRILREGGGKEKTKEGRRGFGRQGAEGVNTRGKTYDVEVRRKPRHTEREKKKQHRAHLFSDDRGNSLKEERWRGMWGRKPCHGGA